MRAVVRCWICGCEYESGLVQHYVDAASEWSVEGEGRVAHNPLILWMIWRSTITKIRPDPISSQPRHMPGKINALTYSAGNFFL